ncbi:MAG: methyltransferase domain-containing protein [Patescibacteria group bacterium]|jgi:ubiquinone/menaquinone biosynthesis C-methylase UbiE
MQKYQNFENWNEIMAQKYNPDHHLYNPNFVIRLMENQRLKEIIKMLEAQTKDKIIELGCGTGNIILKIKSNNIVGIDLSEFMLNIAKEKLSNKKGVKLIKGNIEYLPKEITDNTYDKVVCSEIIEHIENPQKMINEILKITTQKSDIIFSIPNEALINKIKSYFIKLNLFNKLFPKIPQRMDHEWHLHFFSLKKLTSLVEDKFKIIKIVKIPFAFLPLGYVIKLKKK